MPGQTFELGDVILAAMDERLAGVFTSMPGTVVKYDEDEQSVDVQPMVYHGYYNEEGQVVSERLPVIPRVPLIFPGSGASRMTFPINIGDMVWVVCANCSLDRVLATGRECNPGDFRRHSLQDAWAIPGGITFIGTPLGPSTDAPMDATVINAPNKIRLGSSGASRGVARQGDQIALTWDRIQTILDTRYSIQNPTTDLNVEAGVAPDADGAISTSSSKVESE